MFLKFHTPLYHCVFVTQLEVHSNTVYLIMLISVWACQDLLFQSIVSVVRGPAGDARSTNCRDYSNLKNKQKW